MSKNGWWEVVLGDICEVKGGKRMPKGSSLIKERNIHPYIKVKDIPNSKMVNVNSNFEYVPGETFDKISRYIVDSNDLIISIVGTIGSMAIVGKTLSKASLTENCVKIINIKRHNI